MSGGMETDVAHGTCRVIEDGGKWAIVHYTPTGFLGLGGDKWQFYPTFRLRSRERAERRAARLQRKLIKRHAKRAAERERNISAAASSDAIIRHELGQP